MDLKDRSVISLDQLTSLTRRDFCRAAGVGLATLIVPACGGASGPGPGPGDDGGSPADLAQPPDLATASSCPAGVTDTGMPPAAFKINTATFFKNDHVFVCHDAMGLYAVTSLCTHEQCDVMFISFNTTFFCNCHGSRFDFAGEVTKGPAGLPLDHFALCLAQGGSVAFDTNTPADKAARLAA